MRGGRQQATHSDYREQKAVPSMRPRADQQPEGISDKQRRSKYPARGSGSDTEYRRAQSQQQNHEQRMNRLRALQVIQKCRVAVAPHPPRNDRQDAHGSAAPKERKRQSYGEAQTANQPKVNGAKYAQNRCPQQCNASLSWRDIDRVMGRK